MTENREFFSVNYLEIAIGNVRDMVAMFRRRGVKSEHAMPEVAEILDISPKRVKSLFYRDGVWNIQKKEAQSIEARFVSYLDREIDLSIRYTEQLRLRKLQRNLGLKCEDQNSSQLGFGFNLAISRTRSAA